MISVALIPNILTITSHRDRNREHAKQSRERKKELTESMQQVAKVLEEENESLRRHIRHHLGPEAEGLLARSKKRQRASLEDPDFSFVKALQKSHLNFVVTDPHLPDNPIVYATHGFLDMTGYRQEEVVNRNMRFLLGPQTNPAAIARIQDAIASGASTSVPVLNYKADGTTFWNQLSVTPLAGSDGSIVNFVLGSLVLPRLSAPI